ncbi:NAD(P)-binding protein [Periconia macrospinosa]|uniref:NAD(P)-binding protein n=1 Tax=Periconia macrospinosa TaxID=97972 RepID=A0A2V1E2P8_9PLEO|nr:NAD(P)-binding protein [Periconia macrospinosa]
MSHIVGIAGGTGGLGRALVDALKNSPHKPIVLARQANPELETQIGVPVLQAPYSDQDAFVKLLEEHKIDTIISTISNYGNSHSTEISIIEAAELSGVTKRYIPSIWSAFDYTLRNTKTLEWTAIFPGVFLDYYTLTRPSYTKRTALALDVDNNAAAIPGDGTYPVYFTHTTDVARYTAALLGLDRWESEKHFVFADQKTWNEVLELAESAKGVKFDVVYDEVEKLRRGEMTLLPGQEAVVRLFYGGDGDEEEAKAAFRKTMAGVAAYMAEGQMVYDGRVLLNEIFPDIKALTVREALIESS